MQSSQRANQPLEPLDYLDIMGDFGNDMATAQIQYTKLLKELAVLMVSVAGESVTMVKRSAPEQSLKLKKRAEWSLYLEFLKILFNLADRLSAFYVPIQEQPRFMNSLEDAVGVRLKAALTPALGPDLDGMEITLTIGNTVAESRQVYEKFRFVVTEESPARVQYFDCLAGRVAHLLEVSGNPLVSSAATLCAGAAIPAMKSLFEGMTGPATAHQAGSPERTGTEGTGSEIKLVSVMSTVRGEEVETRWGLHPRFRQDLNPEEAKELTRLMNEVTQILGQRYAAVAFSSDWATRQRSGHA